MDNMPFQQFSPAPWQDDELPADLRAVARHYANQPPLRPAPSETAQLMQRLLAEATFSTQGTQQKQGETLWQILALARWRVYMLGPWFWIASVLLLLPCIWFIPYIAANHFITLLVLVLPLTAILSLAHALRTHSPGLRSIEACCPVNFIQATLGLVLAILALDCLLGLVATLSLALVRWVPFWNLLLAWLAPLLLLTAISLPIALLRSTRLAMLIGSLPWLLLGLVALFEQKMPRFAAVFFTLPQDTFSLTCHLAMITFSIILLLALFTGAPRWQRFCAL